MLPKQQAARVQTKDIDPFECDISKGDMNHENVSNLLLQENDDVICIRRGLVYTYFVITEDLVIF